MARKNRHIHTHKYTHTYIHKSKIYILLLQQRILNILEINKANIFKKKMKENKQDYKANLKILK